MEAHARVRETSERDSDMTHTHRNPRGNEYGSARGHKYMYTSEVVCTCVCHTQRIWKRTRTQTRDVKSRKKEETTKDKMEKQREDREGQKHPCLSLAVYWVRQRVCVDKSVS